ncbi:hypothetical protein K438DRAFT_1844438 [Mycena galopus ATCC 62051]|nr:hypothetical protein K438DRAFT_1844438 [Mycena galopus ATCC 62051]
MSALMLQVGVGFLLLFFLPRRERARPFLRHARRPVLPAALVDLCGGQRVRDVGRQHGGHATLTGKSSYMPIGRTSCRARARGACVKGSNVVCRDTFSRIVRASRCHLSSVTPASSIPPVLSQTSGTSTSTSSRLGVGF